MALNVANLGPGNYVLGGPGRRQGPSAAEAMDLAQREEQRFRDAQRAARETEQRMALAQSQEARAQQQFQAQQAARAQAAAAAAAQQRAGQEYMQAVQAQPAGVRQPAPISPVADIRPGVGGFPLAPAATGGRSIIDPRIPFPGAPVAETADASFAGLRNIEFMQGALPAEPQRMFMTPESMGVRAGLAQATTLPPALGSRAEAAQRDMQIADTQRQIAALDSQIAAITDALTAPGSRANVAASTRVIQNLAAQRDALRAQLVPSIAPAIEARTLTGEEGPGATGLAPPLPRTTERRTDEETKPVERTGQDPFITETETEAGPIAGLTPAGAANPLAAMEALAASAPGGDVSAFLITNPALVLDLGDQLARERQMLEARLRYAEATGNIALFENTYGQLNSRERVLDENMVQGQIALVAAQQDNFGPLQEFLDRAHPDKTVRLVPYTNDKISIFVDGVEDTRMSTAAMLEGLARSFNADYQSALSAAAEEARSLRRLRAETAITEQARMTREIAVLRAGLENLYGKVDSVADPGSGRTVFQVFDPQRGYVQFRIVEPGETLINGQEALEPTLEELPPIQR